MRVDFDAAEIDDGAAVQIFGPWNSNDKPVFCRNEFRVARWRIPFAHNVGLETLALKELADCRDSVLICAVPVLPEIITLKKIFDSRDPLGLHKEIRF